MLARSTSHVVSCQKYGFPMHGIAADTSVIENKDAVRALNVIHESCLTIPVSPIRPSKTLQAV